MKLVTPAEAVSRLDDASLVLFPGGTANPAQFFTQFSAEVERFSDLTVASGVSLGEYAYLERGLGTHFHYLTWQAAPRLRRLFKENDRSKVSFVPIRLSDVTRTVGRNAPIVPDAAVLHTSLPQSDGTVSLGSSVGPNQHFVREAPLVIAEMSANMPVTGGDSRVALAAIDIAFESDSAPAIYSTGTPSAREETIVEHVLSLVPEQSWVQVGIGAVPDRILARLGEVGGVNLFSGMLSQGLHEFATNAGQGAQIINGELAGNETLYRWSDGEMMMSMQGLDVTHNPAQLAGLNPFVSINSAIEIDLQGQSNGETIGATQVSGVGGSLDYIEAASKADSGVSIIALPSTTAGDKYSKIVAQLGQGSVVTTPRFCTDYVITEYGIASLRGKSLWQRADALIGIAHPAFRDELANAL